MPKLPSLAQEALAQSHHVPYASHHYGEATALQVVSAKANAILQRIVIANTLTTAFTVVFYDNTAASGAVYLQVTVPGNDTRVIDLGPGLRSTIGIAYDNPAGARVLCAGRGF